jgi:hypothetical protein
MLINARVINRTSLHSTVEVTVTLQTVIREGRTVPTVTHDGAAITDDEFARDIHEMLDDQTVLVQEEMNRVCG